jgi:hypothetical protein
MTKQARRSVGRAGKAGRAAGARAAGAMIAAFVVVLPLSGVAAAAEHDRHASMQTEIIVRATAGQLVLAHRDVIAAGGHVVSGRPVANGFHAQVPVSAVAGIRHARGISSVVVVGEVIVN